MALPSAIDPNSPRPSHRYRRCHPRRRRQGNSRKHSDQSRQAQSRAGGRSFAAHRARAAHPAGSRRGAAGSSLRLQSSRLPHRQPQDRASSSTTWLASTNPRLAAVLRTVESEVLVLALAGADEELIERIADQMPRSTAKAFRRRMRKLGPTRLRDVSTAQQDVADVAARIIQARRRPNLAVAG